MHPQLSEKLTEYQLHTEMTRTDYFSVITATRIADNRSLLLVVLNPDMPYDAYFVRRFKDVVERNKKLDHPHILKTLAVIETDGLLMCTLDFPGGEPLETYLRQHTSLPITEVTARVRQIATALDYAHGQALRHGNLSTNAVFVDGDSVYLACFGLAQLFEEVGQVETAHPFADNRYLSPERLHGESPSRAADLYALGVLCYQMLTGVLPFAADERVSRRELPVPPHTLNGRVRPAVSEVVLRMLSRGVELRQTTGAEFVRALQVAAEGSAPMRPITAATIAVKIPAASASPRLPVSSKRLGLIAVMALVVLLALVGGFGLITRWEQVTQIFPRSRPAPSAMVATPVLPTPMPQSLPTALSPSPTPTPIISTATPVPSPKAATPVADSTVTAGSPFSQLVLAEGISDNYHPVNPNTVFSTGTKAVYLFFHYQGITPGTPWQVEWRYNGSTVQTGSDNWSADYGTVGTAWVFYKPIDGFKTGEYSVRLAINGKVVATAVFEGP